MNKSTGPGRDFDSTNWSVLARLRDRGSPDYQERLSALIGQYWKPAYHYIRTLRRAMPAEEAQDLTQDFFARLLEKGYLENLDPGMGSFRGYLKTALRRFVSNAERAGRARLPRDGARLFRFDQAEEEWARLAPASAELAPEQAFDRAWARDVLRDAIAQLEQVLAAVGKESTFDLFRAYYLKTVGIDGGPASPEPSYAELAQRHGMTEHEVRHRLRVARAELRRLLTERVKEYAGSRTEVAREIRFLLAP